MKKRLKKLTRVFVALAVLGLIILFVFPIRLRLSHCETMAAPAEGLREFNPLSDFDFQKDQWRAYILLDAGDFVELPPGIPHASALVTSDPQVLEKMKAGWTMSLHDGDMATVTSAVLIFKNDKLVFESGLVLGDKMKGLQNSNFGWATPVDGAGFISPIKSFRSVRWPILVL